ncbi:hypothetical protein Rsub_13096 [Raphidocelis subcapitata]|uniref:SAM domain-containing protein n=1 Tax=Raphidocelis subcapitata TaxID=307507 RepID=A0A2V0PLL9_9CHLO|nr:hypothetical protein Rsub_13096 [Raphidocelis subcapitata]|eukprot:GBG00440.1 hypothetical protein Rsub_13096 [Raphidocelis subcapitata]
MEEQPGPAAAEVSGLTEDWEVDHEEEYELHPAGLEGAAPQAFDSYGQESIGDDEEEGPPQALQQPQFGDEFEAPSGRSQPPPGAAAADFQPDGGLAAAAAEDSLLSEQLEAVLRAEQAGGFIGGEASDDAAPAQGAEAGLHERLPSEEGSAPQQARSSSIAGGLPGHGDGAHGPDRWETGEGLGAAGADDAGAELMAAAPAVRQRRALSLREASSPRAPVAAADAEAGVNCWGDGTEAGQPPSRGSDGSWQQRPSSAGGGRPRSSGRSSRRGPAAGGGPLETDGGERPSSGGRGARRRPSGGAGSSCCMEGGEEEDLLPPECWDVSEVGRWLAAIGLEQYRLKFVHHVIDGALLLRLGDAELKAELGIGPLGHRVALLAGIEELAEGRSAFASDVCREFAASRRRAGEARRGGAGRGGSRPASPAGSAGGRGRDGGGGGEAKRPRSAPTMRARAPAGPAGGVLAGGAFLGPASGQTTVAEQRSKLLCALSRAQARAAARGSAAERTGEVARLAAAEAARLAAAVRELDRRFRPQLEHATGTLDSAARVPWQHVGPGTHAADPHPERHGRPWDGPAVDETFSPKISAKSRRIMSPGGGDGAAAGGGAPSFLERLAADERRRARAAADAARGRARPLAAAAAAGPDGAREAERAARADAALVARWCAERWGAAPPLPGARGGAAAVEAYQRDAALAGPGGELPGASAAVEAALDSVLTDRREELLLPERRAAALLAARGRAKVAGLAAAARAVEFMERYRSDLATRDRRLAELQGRWLAAAAPGRGPKAAEARDAAAAGAWFSQLGWPQEAGADDPALLEALLARAAALKAEWDRQRDRERDRPQEAKSAGPPAFDWGRAPWSVDGLTPLMEEALSKQRAAASATAPKAATPPKKATPAAAAAGASDAPAPPQGTDWLGYTVRLLAGLPAESLERLQAAPARVAVYRAVRSQRFLEFTQEDLRAREAKQIEIWRQLTGRHGKVVSKQEMDAFFERLQEDGRRRIAALEKAKADRAAQEAKALAAARDAAARMTGRRPAALAAVPAAGRRPASAPPGPRKER